MKRIILWSTFSCLVVFSFIGISIARDPEPRCNEYVYYNQSSLQLTCHRECDRCTASCDKEYNTPKYDVWKKLRVESEITYSKRVKCKNNCLTIRDGCIDRKRNLEEVQNTQTQPTVGSPFGYRSIMEEQDELESQDQDTQQDSPLDTNIYKWMDKNGVNIKGCVKVKKGGVSYRSQSFTKKGKGDAAHGKEYR